MSWEQIERKTHNIMIGNKSFEMVENFKCLLTTVTNQTALIKELTAEQIRESLLAAGTVCFVVPWYLQEDKD